MQHFIVHSIMHSINGMHGGMHDEILQSMMAGLVVMFRTSRNSHMLNLIFSLVLSVCAYHLMDLVLVGIA